MNRNQQTFNLSFWISTLLSILFGLSLVLLWNQLPHTFEVNYGSNNAEIYVRTQENLDSLKESLNLSEEVIELQVGAYIKKLRIVSPDVLEVGGYLWSRTEPEHPDTLLLNMKFDRLHPKISQQQDQLYYRRRVNFHQKSYLYRIHLKDSYSLRNYPFDIHKFRLPFKAPKYDNTQKVLFPDLGIYTNFYFPEGIHIHLAGPGQEFSTRDTYFGFSPRANYSDGNPLSFYFILQRNAIRSLLFHLLPLLLIIIVYHMLFWAIGRDGFRIDNGFKRSLIRLGVYGSGAYLLLAYGLLKIRLWDFGPIYLDLIYLAVFVLHIPLSIILLKSLARQSPGLALPNLHLWIVPSWLAFLLLGTLIWFY